MKEEQERPKIPREQIEILTNLAFVYLDLRFSIRDKNPTKIFCGLRRLVVTKPHENISAKYFSMY